MRLHQHRDRVVERVRIARIGAELVLGQLGGLLVLAGFGVAGHQDLVPGRLRLVGQRLGLVDRGDRLRVLAQPVLGVALECVRVGGFLLALGAPFGDRVQRGLVLLVGHLELRQHVHQLEVGVVRHHAECQRALQRADRALVVAVVVVEAGHALQRQRLRVLALAAIDDRLQHLLGLGLVACVDRIQAFVEVLLILLAGQVELRLGAGRVRIQHFLLGFGVVALARHRRAAGHAKQQGNARQHG